jgi:hypothetical protein
MLMSASGTGSRNTSCSMLVLCPRRSAEASGAAVCLWAKYADTGKVTVAARVQKRQFPQTPLANHNPRFQKRTSFPGIIIMLTAIFITPVLISQLRFWLATSGSPVFGI